MIIVEDIQTGMVMEEETLVHQDVVHLHHPMEIPTTAMTDMAHHHLVEDPLRVVDTDLHPADHPLRLHEVVAAAAVDVE